MCVCMCVCVCLCLCLCVSVCTGRVVGVWQELCVGCGGYDGGGGGGEGGGLLSSYRLPWSAVPGGGAWAGLLVALLHVRGHLQDVTVAVVESMAAGLLADHQPGPPAPTTCLGALRAKTREKK